MATSSFLKNVNIKGKARCQDFVKALEASASTPKKEVTFSKSVGRLDRGQIEKIFGDK